MNKKSIPTLFLCLSSLASFGACSGAPANASTTAEIQSQSLEMSRIQGILQIEKNCVLAGHDDGCLRLVTQSHGLYYFKREAPDTGAEFGRVGAGAAVAGLSLIQVFLTDQSSVLISDNQPIALTGRIRRHGTEGDQGGTILSVDQLSLTGDLFNPELGDGGPRCGNN